MIRWTALLLGSWTFVVSAADAPPQPAPSFDKALAAELGADEHGMRRYVLVILTTGPNRKPDGPERDAMFKGHFANMQRLADEGKLALAGPLDGVQGRRGLFVFAVDSIEEAKALAATDPVLIEGEMVAEYHQFFSSAALMSVNATHARIAEKPM